MPQTYNIYCDESGHLENDQVNVMVLGAVWCPSDKVTEISNRLREIKRRHNLSDKFELKWTKVSIGKFQYYLDVMDYFFDDDDLHSRVLIVPDKTKLRHEDFHQNHDDWYYFMYFDMLKTILNPKDKYRIYLDIKDTNSAKKIKKLHDALCNNLVDFSREIIERVQTVRSHEVEQIQLTDLLIGAVSYANRNLITNSAKLKLVERMRIRSGYELTKTTLPWEQKVNILSWNAS